MKPGELIFKTIKNLDRRIIFVIILLAVLIPLMKPFGLSIETTEAVRKAFKAIDELPPGTKVLISFDYGPSTKPELHPLATAFVRHCFRKNLKVIAIALWPDGASMAEDIFRTVTKEYNKKYGEDYVNLGYKAGGLVVIQRLGSDLPSTFPTDIDGIPISNLPIMEGVNNYHDIGIVLSVSAGDPGIKYYILLANAQYHVTVSGGCTAVSAPEFYPYINSGQLTGLCGGMKGAAEYEKLIGQPGLACAGMDSQSMAHLFIILFIIIANIIYILEKYIYEKSG